MGRRAPSADALRNRARILTAAHEAFGHDGVEVPLDTIAERAGVGAGTVHRHFPTKEALVTAVITDRLDHLADRAAELGDNPPRTSSRSSESSPTPPATTWRSP